jgi:hypothetical protein
MSSQRLGVGQTSALAGSAPRVKKDFFRLVNRDAVLGNVLDISLGVVFQVPEDGGVDHRNLL